MNIQFQFDNELYRQIDGVAMSSPLVPLLADIYGQAEEQHSE